MTIDMNTLQEQAVQPGQLPDAPLAMPKQVLEGPRLTVHLGTLVLGFARRLMPGRTQGAGH